MVCALSTTKLSRPEGMADPWQKALELQASGTPIDAKIVGVNKGGVKVKVNDLKGFIPYSKISPNRLRPGHKGDLSYLIGQTLKGTIVQVDLQSARKELVLSERAAMQTLALKKLSVGDIVEGTVVRLEDYGAFLNIKVSGAEDLDEIQGLVHRTELSWGPVMRVEDVLKRGDTVKVKVVEVDALRGRLSLSLRQLVPDPLRSALEYIQWHPVEKALPEVERVMELLKQQEGVEAVTLGREAEEQNVFSQELQLFLNKEVVEGGVKVLARSGRTLQELVVMTQLSTDEVKNLLQAVLRAAAGGQ